MEREKNNYNYTESVAMVMAFAMVIILFATMLVSASAAMAAAVALPKPDTGVLFKDGVSLKTYQQVKYGSRDYFVLKQSQSPCALATEVAYGKPYTILGSTYLRLDHTKNFVQTGSASWYGPDFHGKLTANGETYNMYDMTAAHKTLPMDARVEVTNLDNGRKVVVRINDRGPFKDGRIIDLTKVAANKIGMLGSGTANVMIRTVGTPSYVINAYHPLLASIDDADTSFCNGNNDLAEASDITTIPVANAGMALLTPLTASNTIAITKDGITGAGGVVEYDPAAITPIIASAPVVVAPVPAPVPAPVVAPEVDEVLPVSEPVPVVDEAEAEAEAEAAAASEALANEAAAVVASPKPVEQSTSIDGNANWKSYSGDVSGAYGIQLGSFSKLANAIKLADVIDGSKVVDIWVDEMIYSRVIIDGFASRDDAKRQLDVVRRDYPKAYIVSLQ